MPANMTVATAAAGALRAEPADRAGSAYGLNMIPRVEPEGMLFGVMLYAARTVRRKLSTSVLRLPLSFESERADASTWAEAEPVALAP